MASPLRSAEYFEQTHTRRQTSEVMGVVLDPTEVLPPRPEEVFSDIAIKDWQVLKTRDVRGVGRLETSLVSLEDGSEFVFKKAVPERQDWENSADFTLPLATRMNGFNDYLLRRLAKAGIHTRAVGTNHARGFTLKHDSLADLAILNHDDERQKESHSITVTPGQSAILGYSMGEMKALAKVAYAGQAGRNVLFNLGLDPCLANKVDYRAQKSDPVGLALYLGRETLEVPRMMATDFSHDPSLKSVRRSLHLMKTIGLTPEYFRSGKDKWDIIATGETGTFLDDLPKGAVIALNFFSKCRFNDFRTYQEKLSEPDYPNIRITVEDGYHLSGAEPAVINRVIGRTATALHLVEVGAKPSHIADALKGPILKID